MQKGRIRCHRLSFPEAVGTVVPQQKRERTGAVVLIRPFNYVETALR